jgi:hypothetical protein
MLSTSMHKHLKKLPKLLLPFNYLQEKDRSRHGNLSKKIHGHRLLNLTADIIRIFVDRDKELYISREGKETDEFIQNAYKSIENIGAQYDNDALVAFFDHKVKMHYDRFYMRLKEDEPLIRERPGWKYLLEQFANPNTKYLKYTALARILFPLLDEMDMCTRYPMTTVNNNNIAFLMDPKVKKSCLLLDEMVYDLISLIPLIWKQIESLN